MEFNLAKFQWEIDSNDTNEQIIRELIQQNPQFSEKFIKLCVGRGLRSHDDIQTATDPQPQLFHDPFLFYGMDLAVNRIQQAIMDNQIILIYGDYDADGVTSTLILLEALESIGANVLYYLPNRLTDGYGPNQERWIELIDQYAINLIITCDNGVAGHQAIDSVNQKGVDVIVTDHHELQATLPDAYAIIHPKHPQGDYPFEELSGAGVALKLATALLEEIPVESLELAAIGTVADLVSLKDENRTIVLSGLKLMQETLRIGLIKLFEEENIETKNLNTDTIGFIIGPRLNAVGRLGDPTPALELLRTHDSSEAEAYLKLINEKNYQRQQLTQKITEEVDKKVSSYDKLPPIIIESGSEWPAGILGIVAGKIMEKFHRPTILFQYIEEESVYKGSGRSLSRVNIYKELDKVKDFILHFGGHSQAAGLTVNESNWHNFVASLSTNFQIYQVILQEREKLPIDMEIDLEDIDVDFIQEINLLGPFGMDNPRPLFLIRDSQIREIRQIGSQKNHIKMVLNQQEDQVNVVGFSMADQCQDLLPQDQISVVGELNINEWQGRIQSQIQLRDIGVKGSQWIDWRGSKVADTLYLMEGAVYLFNQQNLANKFRQYVSEANLILTYRNIDQVPSTASELVIMECPSHIDQLTRIIKQLSWEKIHLGAYQSHSKYLAGPIQRQDLVKLYKFIHQFPDLDYNPHLVEIAHQLQIAYIKVKTMFLVFLEAEFVTMIDGQLKLNSKSLDSKRDLSQLTSFREYHSSMEGEALLNFKPIQEIKAYFEGK